MEERWLESKAKLTEEMIFGEEVGSSNLSLGGLVDDVRCKSEMRSFRASAAEMKLKMDL